MVQQDRHRGRVQRGGHHQHHQVRAQGAAHLPTQGQPQIGVQGPFVKFVKNHRADAGQFRVGLHHPGQNAFGHDLDPGLSRYFRLAAHPVADCLTRRFTQCLGHTLCCGPNGQTPGFEHDDPALDQPGL